MSLNNIHSISQSKDNSAWKYIHIDTRENMIMSGWKLYIFGKGLKQAYRLENILLDTVERYNLTTKVATKDVIDRNWGRPIAWSAMVIYLTDLMFQNQNSGITNLLNNINSNLLVFNYENQGDIMGARTVNFARFGKQIHYRYDLDIPVDPRIGIPYDEYLAHYRGETGKYDIIYNEDPFLSIKY